MSGKSAITDEQERRIYDAAASGVPRREIADRYGISVRSVQRHVAAEAERRRRDGR